MGSGLLVEGKVLFEMEERLELLLRLLRSIVSEEGLIEAVDGGGIGSRGAVGATLLGDV